MISRSCDWIKGFGAHEFNPAHSGYLRFIIVFGIIFTILQISDLMLTNNALKNPEIRELNPLYGQDWFVPVKLAMVLLIMCAMYHMPENSRRLAKNAMAGMIFMYLFINMNNLYFLLAS